MKTIPYIVQTLADHSGILYVDLTPGQLVGAEGHPDEMVHGVEDLGGEMRPVAIRLGDIVDGQEDN